MTDSVGGIEYYIDADAQAVLKAGDKVHETTAGMSKDFGIVDKAVQSLIAKQVALGSTVDKTGNIVDKFGNVNTKATAAVKQLIDKQNQLKASAANVDAAYQKLNSVSGRTNKNFRVQKGFMQQAGYQVGDFAVQVQGGQNAMVAFNQQFAQLAGFLGPGGAVIGAVAAVAGALATALLPSLFNSGEETQKLIDKLKELAETQLLTADQAAFLSSVETKSQAEKEKKIKAIEKEIKADEKALKAQQELGKGITATSQYIRGGATAMTQSGESIKSLSERLLENKANLSLLNIEVGKGKDKLSAYKLLMEGSTVQTEDQKKASDELIKSLTEQSEAIGKSNRDILESKLVKLGASEADIKTALAAYNAIKAEESRAKAIKASDDAAIKQQQTHESVLLSYQNQVAQLSLNTKQQDEYNARKKLELDDTQALPAAIQAEIDALEALRVKNQELADQEANNKKITQEFEQIKTDNMNGDPLKALEENLTAERDIIKAHLAMKLEDEALSNAQREALKLEHESLLTGIEQDATNARMALAEAENRAKMSALSGAFNNLSSLMNTESKKMFEVGKAAALAGAIVDGIAAVQGAFKIGNSIGGPPLGFAYAAAAGVAQAVNVQNIAKQKIGGASSGTSSFSGGKPVVNTGNQQASGPSQNISIAGINPNSLFTGGQIIELLNQALGDGYTLAN